MARGAPRFVKGAGRLAQAGMTLGKEVRLAQPGGNDAAKRELPAGSAPGPRSPTRPLRSAKTPPTLGRDISNDIVINDRETSRHHLRLVRSGDTMTIEDLGSTNGTFVNGKRVSGVTPLQNGDMIGLGETVTLALEIFGAQPAALPAAQPPTLDPLPLPAADMSTPAPAYTPPVDYGLQGTPPSPAVPADPLVAPAGDALPPQPAYPQFAEGATPPEQQPAYYGQQRPGIKCRPRRRNSIPVMTMTRMPRAKKAAAHRPG